ncbi:Scr1 family TA system antitoxin-like transcriptional regulator [Streptomyces niveiscabiei]|uniref:Scr1 family TA system antitoxin-like transcriptional regulator n=1 Tax=Streptomyces niveiscabiei TaxID=164115 RepID=UPI003899F205
MSRVSRSKRKHAATTSIRRRFYVSAGHSGPVRRRRLPAPCGCGTRTDQDPEGHAPGRSPRGGGSRIPWQRGRRVRPFRAGNWGGTAGTCATRHDFAYRDRPDLVAQVCTSKRCARSTVRPQTCVRHSWGSPRRPRHAAGGTPTVTWCPRGSTSSSDGKRPRPNCPGTRATWSRGPLQTADYAQAIIRAGNPEAEDDEIERRVNPLRRRFHRFATARTPTGRFWWPRRQLIRARVPQIRGGFSSAPAARRRRAPWSRAWRRSPWPAGRGRGP